jgi:hypothetical protein
VYRQKALNKHSEKTAAEGACEYKKTDVDWIHSYRVRPSQGILTGIAKRSHENQQADGYLILPVGCSCFPQNPQLEEKLKALKQNQANNKQKLAQYTWTETETIATKGETKNTKVYQVQMVNGQQKAEVSNQKAQQGGREGRLKKRVIEKKTAEYQQYGQQRGARQAIHHA